MSPGSTRLPYPARRAAPRGLSRIGAALLVLTMALAAASIPRGASAAPRGSRLEFHGWSRDSRWVAYTRRALGRTGKEQRMHRLVVDGAFAGFGSEVGGDVQRFALAHNYVSAPAPQRRVDPMTFEFGVGERTFTLVIEPGTQLGWRLSRDGRTLAKHTFDSLYVDFAVELYPAPDAAQAILVMHLDTGWQVDAAVFPVPL